MEQQILRVGPCPHHPDKRVVQEFVTTRGNTDTLDGWMCIHNEDEELDEEDVKFFDTYNLVLVREPDGRAVGTVDVFGKRVIGTLAYVTDFGYKIYPPQKQK